jgi:hypothetical protein
LGQKTLRDFARSSPCVSFWVFQQTGSFKFFITVEALP